MRISCPNCKCDIDVVAQDQLQSCPSCGSRLSFLDETMLQTRTDLKIVAHFELVEHVGTGHFGEVWKARDVVLGRHVALKIPRTRQLEEATIKLFVREARAAAMLRHDNIVTVHEVFRDNEAVYIVSDFIQGVTLAEQMRVKRREPRESAALCATIAEALDYAHNHGVEAHRDVKPGNIMIAADGKPSIMDFGLAKLDAAEFTMTVAGELLGTPAYMSPEQAQGVETDRRTDVYSLGVVLYELLTHHRPFTGETRLLLHQIVSDEPRPPRKLDKSVPRDLETICLKAMAKDPERRYATAGAFAEDLRRYLHAEPILAKPVGRMERGWRWARRNPYIATPATVAVLLLVALAAMLWKQRQERLAGFRDVALTTDPAGARVVVVPLNEFTREPLLDQIERPAGVTPLELKLRPGPYLIVAVKSDVEFHEVYRRVPKDPDEGRGDAYHNSWETLSDGTIELPAITIPKAADVTVGMVRFDGGEFEMGSDKMSYAPKHRRQVNDFYLGETEVTNGEFQALLALPQWMAGRPADQPVTMVTYDNALSYAELAGLRLMTEAEYEYAATQQGATTYPWGDDAQQITPSNFQIQSVRKPAFDQTAGQRVVYGLYSNASEWTDSPQIPYVPGSTPLSDALLRQISVMRVIRGGPTSDSELAAGDSVPPALLLGPRRRAAVNEAKQQQFVGFRCARSVRPRFVDD